MQVDAGRCEYWRRTKHAPFITDGKAVLILFTEAAVITRMITLSYLSTSVSFGENKA